MGLLYKVTYGHLTSLGTCIHQHMDRPKPTPPSMALSRGYQHQSSEAFDSPLGTQAISSSTRACMSELFHPNIDRFHLQNTEQTC